MDGAGRGVQRRGRQQLEAPKKRGVASVLNRLVERGTPEIQYLAST
jgi:hypothetical protein